jgi:hypothetical protein
MNCKRTSSLVAPKPSIRPRMRVLREPARASRRTSRGKRALSLPAVAGDPRAPRRSRAFDQGCESRASRGTSLMTCPLRVHPCVRRSRAVSSVQVQSSVRNARPNPSRINTSANSSFFIKSLIINDLKSNRMSERGNKSPRINTSENYRSKSFRINTSRNHRGEVVGPNCKSRSLTNVRQNRATRFGMTIRGGGEW